MSLARALAFNIVFWVGTVIFGIAGLPFLLTPRRTAMRFGRFWAQAVLAALKRLIAAARRAIAMGRPVVIFPQGTRTSPGLPASEVPYHPGVAALYRELAVPLVPAAVNSGLYWGRRAFMKRRGRIVLEFLEPIPPGLPRRQVMETLETRIEAATASLEREANYPRSGNQSSPPLPII